MQECDQFGVMRVKKKEKKWWHDPLFLVLVSILGTGTFSFFIASHIFNKQKAELGEVQLIVADKKDEIAELKKENKVLRDRMPEMPITVVDKDTGNQLYIGRPIPRLTHYEFPITLNDGQGSYRIDQYNWLNRYSGKLIVIKEMPK